MSVTQEETQEEINSLFYQTSREKDHNRPLENFVFLVFDDLILAAMDYLKESLTQFSYTGQFGSFYVENLKITKPKKIRSIKKNGTIEITERESVNEIDFFGGGAFHLLNKYFKQINPNNEDLYETSGLTSDIDVSFNYYIESYDKVTPQIEQEYEEEFLNDILDNNNNVKQMFENLLYNYSLGVLEKFMQSQNECIQNKLNFCSSYIEFLPYSDGKIIKFELTNRINLHCNMRRKNTNDEFNEQHLTDIFFKKFSYKNPNTTRYDIFELNNNLRFSIVSIYELLTTQYKATFNRLLEPYHRNLRAEEGKNKMDHHLIITESKCRNDIHRILWLLKTLTSSLINKEIFKFVTNQFVVGVSSSIRLPSLISNLPNEPLGRMNPLFMFFKTNNINPLDIKENDIDDLYTRFINYMKITFPFLKGDRIEGFDGRDIFKFKINNTGDSEFADSQLYVNTMFDKNYLKAYIFFRNIDEIVKMTPTEKMNLRGKEHQIMELFYSRFKEVITKLYNNFNSFPCISRETQEEQQRIMLIYNKMMKLTSENAKCLIQSHYGNKKITEENFFKTLGKIFVKLLHN